jgi:hypothetical protein
MSYNFEYKSYSYYSQVASLSVHNKPGQVGELVSPDTPAVYRKINDVVTLEILLPRCRQRNIAALKLSPYVSVYKSAPLASHRRHLQPGGPEDPLKIAGLLSRANEIRTRCYDTQKILQRLEALMNQFYGPKGEQ